MFKCQYCRTEWKENADLLKHYVQNHPDKIYRQSNVDVKPYCSMDTSPETVGPSETANQYTCQYCGLENGGYLDLFKHYHKIHQIQVKFSESGTIESDLLGAVTKELCEIPGRPGKDSESPSVQETNYNVRKPVGVKTRLRKSGPIQYSVSVFRCRMCSARFKSALQLRRHRNNKFSKCYRSKRRLPNESLQKQNGNAHFEALNGKMNPLTVSTHEQAKHRPTNQVVSNQQPLGERPSEEAPILHKSEESPYHQSKRPSVNRYVYYGCAFCKEGFWSLHERQKHEEKVHNNSSRNINGNGLSNDAGKSGMSDDSNSYMCCYCSTHCETFTELSAHYTHFHQKTSLKFQCSHCQQKCLRKVELERHYLKDHCSPVMKVKGRGFTIMEFGGNRSSYKQCKFCKQTYSSVEYLVSHYLKAHPDQCDGSVESPDLIQAEPGDQNPNASDCNKCKYCMQTFSGVKELAKHYLNYHGDELGTGVQGTKNNSAKGLTLRIRTGFIHKCSYCRKRYRKLEHLELHCRKKHPRQYAKDSKNRGPDAGSQSRTIEMDNRTLHTCKYCRKHYRAKSKLVQHYTKVHPGLFAMDYLHSKGLKVKIPRNKIVEPIKVSRRSHCFICGDWYSSYSALYEHYQTVHPHPLQPSSQDAQTNQATGNIKCEAEAEMYMHESVISTELDTNTPAVSYNASSESRLKEDQLSANVHVPMIKDVGLLDLPLTCSKHSPGIDTSVKDNKNVEPLLPDNDPVLPCLSNKPKVIDIQPIPDYVAGLSDMYVDNDYSVDENIPSNVPFHDDISVQDTNGETKLTVSINEITDYSDIKQNVIKTEDADLQANVLLRCEGTQTPNEMDVKTELLGHEYSGNNSITENVTSVVTSKCNWSYYQDVKTEKVEIPSDILSGHIKLESKSLYHDGLVHPVIPRADDPFLSEPAKPLIFTNGNEINVPSVHVRIGGEVVPKNQLPLTESGDSGPSMIKPQSENHNTWSESPPQCFPCVYCTQQFQNHIERGKHYLKDHYMKLDPDDFKGTGLGKHLLKVCSFS